MKFKFLIPIVCSIVIGFLLGKVFFDEYDKNYISVFDEKEMIYFIQLGVYKNIDSIKENLSNYEEYLVENEEDGYHVYVGITKTKENAEKIKVYYEKQGNNVYIKRKAIDNESFLNILDEYDKITTIASNEKDLISIEKIVLSNYEEMVLQNEFND